MNQRDYSLKGLNRFLDYAADKGLMKKETASGRKRATNQILGVLDDHELLDLREVDVESAASRFANLQGTNFKPSSLQVYVSRTRSAVQDFISYVDDPINFKSSVNKRTPSGNGGGKKNQKKHKDKSKDAPLSPPDRPHQSDGHAHGAPLQSHSHARHPGTLVFPVPIRTDLIVSISNIPSDLTEQEAAKIAAVIKALAVTSG